MIGLDVQMEISLNKSKWEISRMLLFFHSQTDTIRWCFVIHGAIDGYSWLIVFLRAAGNNLASTVLSVFTAAVDQFGLPSRIRIDRGGENVSVSEYMLDYPEHGPGRGRVIAGRRIHNQGIEILLRDLYAGCVCFF